MFYYDVFYLYNFTFVVLNSFDAGRITMFFIYFSLRFILFVYFYLRYVELSNCSFIWISRTVSRNWRAVADLIRLSPLDPA